MQLGTDSFRERVLNQASFPRLAELLEVAMLAEFEAERRNEIASAFTTSFLLFGHAKSPNLLRLYVHLGLAKVSVSVCDQHDEIKLIIGGCSMTQATSAAKQVFGERVSKQSRFVDQVLHIPVSGNNALNINQMVHEVFYLLNPSFTLEEPAV